MERNEYLANIGRPLSQDAIRDAPELHDKPFTLINYGEMAWPCETVLMIRFDGESYERLCNITGRFGGLHRGDRYTFNSNGHPVAIPKS